MMKSQRIIERESDAIISLTTRRKVSIIITVSLVFDSFFHKNFERRVIPALFDSLASLTFHGVLYPLECQT